MGHFFFDGKAESAKLIMHFLKIAVPPPSSARPKEALVADLTAGMLGGALKGEPLKPMGHSG